MSLIGTTERPRRIVLVVGEFLGYPQSGGLGTATTFLAIVLASAGHRVEILCARRGAGQALDPEWQGRFARKGIEVRMLEQPDDIEPSVLALPAAILGALRDDPPDVAVVQDWGGYGYAALEMRELGLRFPDTLFVIYAHGSRRWIAEAHGNLPDSVDSVLMSLVERAAVELADAVVSPSRYLLEWMRGRGWPLPEHSVAIPLPTEALALGRVDPPPATAPISRLVFFGRLEERKGIAPFIRAVAALGNERLRRLELHFVGPPTLRWSEERVLDELPADARDAVQRIAFHSALSRAEALDEIRRPGTLVVIPSLDDNSPNTVYECLEAGVPFVASAVGGIPELVAKEERATVLFEPTPTGICEALIRSLDAAPPGGPVRPAFDPSAVARAWEEIVQLRPVERRGADEEAPPLVTAVVAVGAGDHAQATAVAALRRQRYEPLEIVTVPTAELDRSEVEGWRMGADRARGEWVLLLVEGDVADDDLVATLIRAQATTGADVVTCAVEERNHRRGPVRRLFLGDRAGGLGLLANAFGTVGLVRRSLLEKHAPELSAAAGAWPLYASIATAGARIVSIPEPLVSTSARTARLERRSAEALDVLRAYEARLPHELASLAPVAVATALRENESAAPSVRASVEHIWRHDGLMGFVRGAGRRARRVVSRQRL